MALDEDAFKVAWRRPLNTAWVRCCILIRAWPLPLQQCHARRYCAAGVTLLGDAAHAIHPLAGQGVNLGLADVQALVAELVRAQERGLPLNHPSVQDRYQRARMPQPRGHGGHGILQAPVRQPQPYVGLARNQALGLRASCRA